MLFLNRFSLKKRIISTKHAEIALMG